MARQISQEYRNAMQAAFLAPVGYEFDTVVGQTNAVIRSIGAYSTIPYTASNFTASGAMTWTVPNGSVSNYDYTQFGGHGYSGGQTLILHVQILNTTVGGTPSTQLKVLLPNSYQILNPCAGTYGLRDNGTYGIGLWEVAANDAVITFYKSDKSNWAASSGATDIRATVVVGVQ